MPVDGADWSPAPWFLVTPPQRAQAVIDRPRVIEAIGEAVSVHRATVVAAPAGFGKTVALGEWSRRRGSATAWLTLTRFDEHPARILRGVVSALQRLAVGRQGLQYRRLLALRPDPDDLAVAYDGLLDALQPLTEPCALVIDDAHLGGGALSQTIVGSLIAHGPSRLRLVLAGRPRLDAHLGRGLVAGEVARLDAETLSFTAEEIVQASVSLQAPVSEHAAETIRATTGGWPAAVRLTLVTDARAAIELDGHAAEPDAALIDYVATEILGPLPRELEDFILAATGCDRVDSRLATVLSGRPDSAQLLEECVARGLFLDRSEHAGAAPVYQWHSVFAAQCQAILVRGDALGAQRLSRLAAEHLMASDPVRAVTHALRGEAPALALRIIRSTWLSLFIGSQDGELNRVCAELPGPYATDPQMLLIRACCLDLSGDRAGGARLFERARVALARLSSGPPAELAMTEAIAELFIADDHARLAAASDRIEALLQQLPDLDPRMYACVLFVLGWIELRTRRDAARAIELLRSAAAECRATGQMRVARRVRGNLGFALGFGGQLTEAERVRKQTSAGNEPAFAWQAYDGGIEWMTEGWVAYWRNDLTASAMALHRVAEGRWGGSISYPALARVYLVYIATVSGNAGWLADAEAALNEVSDSTAHGVPWPTYKLTARARIAEARGELDRALTIARELVDTPSIPVTLVMLAALFRRSRAWVDAARTLRQLGEHQRISYVRASALLTAAIVQRHRGDPAVAHGLLERSLDAAAAESVRRPFGGEEPAVLEMLHDHLDYGTRHEGFIVGCLDRADMVIRRPGAPDGLTPRERDLFGYLHTTLTAAEIAEDLGVSVNTVKTHRQSLYRKLGVSSRRQATNVRAERPAWPHP